MGHTGREMRGKLAVFTSQSLPKAQALFELPPSHSSRFENVETPDGKDWKERNTAVAESRSKVNPHLLLS